MNPNLHLHYPIGSAVRLSATFRDADGDATDPTAITLRVLTPGGGSADVFVYGVDDGLVRDSDGAYHFDVDVDTAGEWFFRWEGTGDVQAAAEHSFIADASRFV